jgi:hypothetical protein
MLTSGIRKIPRRDGVLDRKLRYDFQQIHQVIELEIIEH